MGLAAGPNLAVRAVNSIVSNPSNRKTESICRNKPQITLGVLARQVSGQNAKHFVVRSMPIENRKVSSGAVARVGGSAKRG
jgi:hypothetical protein